jgi:hypothetical protein
LWIGKNLDLRCLSVCVAQPMPQAAHICPPDPRIPVGQRRSLTSQSRTVSGQNFTFQPSHRTSALECRSGPNAYVSGVPNRDLGDPQSGGTRLPRDDGNAVRNVPEFRLSWRVPMPLRCRPASQQRRFLSSARDNDDLDYRGLCLGASGRRHPHICFLIGKGGRKRRFQV